MIRDDRARSPGRRSASTASRRLPRRRAAGVLSQVQARGIHGSEVRTLLRRAIKKVRQAGQKSECRGRGGGRKTERDRCRADGEGGVGVHRRRRGRSRLHLCARERHRCAGRPASHAQRHAAKKDFSIDETCWSSRAKLLRLTVLRRCDPVESSRLVPRSLVW